MTTPAIDELDAALALADDARAAVGDVQRALRANGRDARDGDAVANAIRRLARTAEKIDVTWRAVVASDGYRSMAREDALEDGEARAARAGARARGGGDGDGKGASGLAASAREANARGGVRAETSADDDGTLVRVIAPGAFDARWRAIEPANAATTSARAVVGGVTAAHAALSDRLLEFAADALARAGDAEAASIEILAWLEDLRDVFVVPDFASGGRVLAPDPSRGGVLVPGRLLPGRVARA